jgi:uroporphyrinogen III methyltransferase / synthase
VGAGPGSPSLITLRGIQCLQRAEIVLYDGLVNPAILRHAPPSAQRICVGKHGQGRMWSQREIDDAVIEFAQQGNVVVRLKGGDPAIFARTAEELDRLVREGISFEVVPGVTAAVAASAFSGIPLTHRDWSSAVAFVTAHSQAIDGGEEAEEPLDWQALARFPGTLVFYMGVTTAARWSQHLIDAGKLPTTPVALVRRCSWPDQQVIQCQLSEVAARLTPASAFRPPVLTIVGNVAQFYPQLDWFMHRPLFGTSVLITRPAQQSDALAAQLEELGAEVIIHPAIRIESVTDFTDLDHAIRSLAGTLPQTDHQLPTLSNSKKSWLVFSSRNGVDSFFNRLPKLGYDARMLGNTQIAAVGPGTAAALSEWHILCDCVPDVSFGAESLANKLADQVAGRRCLLVIGTRGRDTLATKLTAAGAVVQSVVAYQNVDEQNFDENILDRMKTGTIDFTTVTSSTIARSLVAAFGESLRKTKLISISDQTSDTLRELGFEPFQQAEEATLGELLPKWKSSKATG